MYIHIYIQNFTWNFQHCFHPPQLHHIINQNDLKVDSTWKKTSTPLPLDVAAHSYHWPYTKSQHLKGRCTGCCLPGNLPWKNSLSSKDTKMTWGSKFKENQWKLEGKSCAAPEMFYSTNKFQSSNYPTFHWALGRSATSLGVCSVEVLNTATVITNTSFNETKGNKFHK